MRKKNKKINKQKGATILISIIFFLFLSLAIVSGLVVPSIREFKIASDLIKSRQSFTLAESGVEDIYYRALTNKTIPSSETINLGENSANVTVSSLGNSQKIISSVGNVEDNERTTGLTLTSGEGVVFKYGTQAGQGGFYFKNNSYITGSIYSNGPVVGSNGAYITGDAYVAGESGSISNMRVGYGGTGDANAHTITGSTVTGNLYCQHGSSNNKACNTSQPDPEVQDLPVKDEDIAQWKADATNGSTPTNGNVTISEVTTLGPKKIIGNLTVDSTLIVANTIYVTGNIIINGTVKLDPSYGANSGIIIADGYIDISNGVIFQDSGTVGSYILLLSESSCDESIAASPCFGNNAIYVGNSSDISIVNAQKGTIYFKNNARVKEAVGNKITLKNLVGISYGTGLINVNFTSGPSGSWAIDSWGETQ